MEKTRTEMLHPKAFHKGKFHIIRRLVDVVYLLFLGFLTFELAGVFAETSEVDFINQEIQTTLIRGGIAFLVYLSILIVDHVLIARKKRVR
ncbi:MAG: hypothetical protein LBD38_02685 [Streptococcaceae bacterium]|jgi:hypothetical protein|nr:hypothetical protein [Streptococcaceae bacterium]